MSRLTPELAKRRSRLSGHAAAARGVVRPRDRRRMLAIPLASLPAPQRRLISALLEAAKAGAMRCAVHADPTMLAPGVGELGSGKLRQAAAGSGTPSSAGIDRLRQAAASSGRLRQASHAGPDRPRLKSSRPRLPAAERRPA